jgi:hypothetical protein
VPTERVPVACDRAGISGQSWSLMGAPRGRSDPAGNAGRRTRAQGASSRPTGGGSLLGARYAGTSVDVPAHLADTDHDSVHWLRLGGALVSMHFAR